MSDCSTNAMKPKDMDMRKSPNASKTCGTCANLVRLSPEEFDEFDACYVCYFQHEVKDSAYPVWPLVCFDDPACEEHYEARSSITNHEYFFGSAERTAEMRIVPWWDELEMHSGVVVSSENEDEVFVSCEQGKSFLEWLKENRGE